MDLKLLDFLNIKIRWDSSMDNNFSLVRYFKIYLYIFIGSLVLPLWKEIVVLFPGLMVIQSGIEDNIKKIDKEKENLKENPSLNR